MGKNLFEIKNLKAGYGKIIVLWDINISINYGEIISLIGPNGAGKTSLVKGIFGFLDIKEGDIIFENKSLTNLPPYEVVRLGISCVFEGRKIFGNMTVEENLLLGAYLKDKRNSIKKNLDFVYTLFPVLKDRRKQQASTLSGGEQQMLAIGRALMNNPKLLLLDEPSLGLAPIAINSIYQTIKTLNETGVSILLIEQQVKRALEISEYTYILEHGKIIKSGKSSALKTDPQIVSSYLGFI